MYMFMYMYMYMYISERMEGWWILDVIQLYMCPERPSGPLLEIHVADSPR